MLSRRVSSAGSLQDSEPLFEYVDFGPASTEAFKTQVKQEGPRDVFVGFRVVNVTEINSITSQAKVDFYLYLRWFDPSMVGQGPDTGFQRKAQQYEQLWNPHVEINNAHDMVTLLEPDASWNFKSSETGEMKYTQRYRGLVDMHMDVRDFPFDAITIPINIGCKVLGNDKVELKADPLYQAPAAKHKLPDWYLLHQGHIESSISVASPTKSYSNLAYKLPFRRRSGFYVNKVLSINILMTVWSWSVFWLPPTEFAERMNIALTLFLASVAFLFVISDKLPKVDFLTSLDKMILFSFSLLFLTALESFVSFIIEEETAESVDYYSRMAFPALYVLVQSALVGSALMHSRNA